MTISIYKGFNGNLEIEKFSVWVLSGIWGIVRDKLGIPNLAWMFELSSNYMLQSGTLAIFTVSELIGDN